MLKFERLVERLLSFGKHHSDTVDRGVDVRSGEDRYVEGHKDTK